MRIAEKQSFPDKLKRKLRLKVRVENKQNMIILNMSNFSSFTYKIYKGMKIY